MKKILAFLILICSTASHAALIGRAPASPGGMDYQAYYDDVLNITWLADANYAQTSGFDADGRMTWDDSLAFVGTLNSGSLLGIIGWRLPNMIDVDNDGCVDEQSTSGGDCGYNIDTENGEMASLFYDTLGNVAFFFPDGTAPQPNYGWQNTGPFTNPETTQLYWYGQEDVSNTSEAWYFGPPSGAQRPREKSSLHVAWAVVDGDALAPIPVPAAAWLFGSALVLLGRLRRKAA